MVLTKKLGWLLFLKDSQATNVEGGRSADIVIRILATVSRAIKWIRIISIAYADLAPILHLDIDSGSKLKNMRKKKFSARVQLQ